METLSSPWSPTNSRPISPTSSTESITSEESKSSQIDEIIEEEGYNEQVDFGEVDPWMKKIFEKSSNIKKENYDETIILLDNLIKENSIIKLCIEEMILEVNDMQNTYFIKNKDDILKALNVLLSIPPSYGDIGGYSAVPFTAFFFRFASTKHGIILFYNKEFNNALWNIVRKWCKYLDSFDSTCVLHKSDNGWLQDEVNKYLKIEQYETEIDQVPYFKSWNNFFIRKIKSCYRPIHEPDNNNAITLPSDGKFLGWTENLKLVDKFWLKNTAYSLNDIFGNDQDLQKYSSIFENGLIFNMYLNPFNYHRWHAPVSGKIVKITTIPGLFFMRSHREQIDLLSISNFLHLSTRGIIIIDTGKKNYGYVSCIPIGMNEISSIMYSVKEGDYINKGEELGYFQYGGSTFAVILEDLSKYGKKLVFDKRYKKVNGKAHLVSEDSSHVGDLVATVTDL